MEVITALVLMLLGAAGARNIPVHKNAPSELPLEFDKLRSTTMTFLATIFSSGELVESVVNEENQGLHWIKNADEDKIVKDHVSNVVSLETDDNGSLHNQEGSKDDQEENMDSVLGPVEVIEVHNNENTEKHFLEDRVAFDAQTIPPPCPDGKSRLGEMCVKEDIDRK